MSDDHSKPVTVSELARLRAAGERFACLTAYDATLARVLDEAGVDVVLVGDTLGVVVQGHATTVPVTLDDMVYHTRAVARGRRRALLMADMPFMTYPDASTALASAARLMQEGGAHMVKLEGDADQATIVEALARHAIPVCAHLGLRPQQVHKTGGYRVPGRDADGARALEQDAATLESAGADVLLLECVPRAVAEAITSVVGVPVIGIGSGASCDGQVLVLHDMLGLTPPPRPRFVRDFMDGAGSVRAAIEAYVAAVRTGSFPADEHTF